MFEKTYYFLRRILRPLLTITGILLALGFVLILFGAFEFDFVTLPVTLSLFTLVAYIVCRVIRFFQTIKNKN